MANTLATKCPWLCFQKALPTWVLLGRRALSPSPFPPLLQSLSLVQQPLFTAQ